MARFGKGRAMDVQARKLLEQYRAKRSRHEEKKAQNVRGSRSTGLIHSTRTFDHYCASVTAAGEWFREENGLRHLSEITPAMGQEYLEMRAGEVGQRQLDNDRIALEFVVGKGVLERIEVPDNDPKPGRSYTPDQVTIIAASQAGRNQLATEVAHSAGLRAHELLTLHRVDEGARANHRDWRDDRFTGREGVRYLVEGKGGLCREVLVPTSLSERLESRRLDAPVLAVDRGIQYASRYDIGGGNTWSRSFTDASKRALGWTSGAHGVRHSYAQERMRELQKHGYPYLTARTIVSQELGHFRGDVVEVYLR